MSFLGLAHPRRQRNAQHTADELGANGFTPLLRTGHLDDERLRLGHDQRLVVGAQPGEVPASLTASDGIARYAGGNGDTAHVRVGS